MRKKKHGEERLDACRELLVNDKEAFYENPLSAFSGKYGEIWLEIGAGKGGFAIEMARRNPSVAYVAMEKVSDCVVLAAESAKAAFAGEDGNLRFLVDTADNLTRLFKCGTVSRIFLNFSDPWTKAGYAKRRLTHRRYLAVYFNLLRDGGILRFKTDNNELFDFSLQELEEISLPPEIITRDLHSSEWGEGNVMTEYERNFSSQGMAINMLEVTKPQGYSIEIPENLSRDRKTYRNNE